ncbi:hypothetical protein CNEO4_540034 [Clostridium neonatale]|uniref:Uncharacterized protein n=1 Tax=Clostridium neonatale TaxID=137838 RepID=A0AA86JKP4_9CLOT|nr:hypothetical protein CNEO_44613 [Clostridium neonatale]CAI3207904.1 hypothetical protein CNEO2_370016 [Clostridium neonatale]CAI3248779.1 hypothetical protein CNEO2_860016 [Clostridium neonatale]CAI3554810.1 hypothetical protein CNEO3_110003 [Clostridium neonatale]CAI3626981.1 hypothetical protein CNEO2_430016 [Clostridium neonatale]
MINFDVSNIIYICKNRYEVITWKTNIHLILVYLELSVMKIV